MDTDAIRARLANAPRQQLLEYLARAIMETTVQNRVAYDEVDALPRLMRGNEVIHRLVGHLGDLTNPDEELTESRISGIIEQIQSFPLNLDRVLGPGFSQ
ncbi:MAG TPA: hypothetical protein VG407_02885 [Caulobacteraceae bacterium]|jgi:hypothetical protein|nr:hypothetical protein [Caulobacteraceae bacterium]